MVPKRSSEGVKIKSRKGFTLIELMVTLLIVAILASVAIPIMLGRIDSARWSEGKGIMGTIAIAIRAYAAEKGELGTYGTNFPSITDMGFATSDFTGTYFNSTHFSWQAAYVESGNPPLTFTVTATAGSGIEAPSQMTLDHRGRWTEN